MIQFDQNIFEMDWFNHHLEEGQPNLQLREEISLSPKIDPGRWESSLKSMVFFYRKVFPCYKIPFRKRLWFNQKSGMNDPPLVLLTSLFLRVLMRTPTSNPLNFHFQMVGVGRFQGVFFQVLTTNYSSTTVTVVPLANEGGLLSVFSWVLLAFWILFDRLCYVSKLRDLFTRSSGREKEVIFSTRWGPYQL